MLTRRSEKWRRVAWTSFVMDHAASWQHSRLLWISWPVRPSRPTDWNANGWSTMIRTAWNCILPPYQYLFVPLGKRSFGTYCSCITWGRCFRSRSIISTTSGSDNEDSQTARSFLALTANVYNFFISSGFPLGVQYLLLVSGAQGVGSFLHLQDLPYGSHLVT